MAIIVHFDGLCEPRNPGGVATFGFTIDRDGRRVTEDSGLAGRPYTEDSTNNVAEYTGLIRALEWILEQGLEKEAVVVRGDSELVIRQLKGEYKVRSPLLAPLHKRVRELSFKFPSLKFEWVPREENEDADSLTKRAYAEYVGEERQTVRVELMKVELAIRAPRAAVAEALRRNAIPAELTEDRGVTRAACQVQADPEAVRKLLDLKRKLEQAGA